MDIAKAKENLSRDFQGLLKHAQSLLDSTSSEMDQKTREARQKLEESLKSAEEAFAVLDERVRQHASNTDKLVRNHPYHAMGIALVGGLLIGWLTGRK